MRTAVAVPERTALAQLVRSAVRPLVMETTTAPEMPLPRQLLHAVARPSMTMVRSGTSACGTRRTSAPCSSSCWLLCVARGRCAYGAAATDLRRLRAGESVRWMVMPFASVSGRLVPQG